MALTGAEHLEWAKTRALKYVADGDLSSAAASMRLDLAKHPDTENHPAIDLMKMMIMAGHLSTPAEMKRFIEGFS
jgi:hypothetical protein